MDKNMCSVCTDEELTLDYHYALESACGDLQFLVSECILLRISLKSNHHLDFFSACCFWQDEVVDTFFAYFDSQLKMLKGKIRGMSSDEVETVLEDLYCASYVLGFRSLASKVKEMQEAIDKNPKNRSTVHSDVFFLKCEAQIAWTEWYTHRSLIDSCCLDSAYHISKHPPTLEDGLAITYTESLRDECAFRIDSPRGKANNWGGTHWTGS